MKALILKEFKHRVITLVNRQELEFLDKVGKDALFSTGHKLSYNEILRGLIDFMMEIGLAGNNLNSQNTLKERLKERMIPKTGTPQERQGG